ncbi:hypothetical protein [Streptosporangium sp. NPDC051022]|uniref:hypothetical protein n=1 Tax=Streptosporangium sp. NPDC051022 TaxID=3155752 RepID=UPI003423CF9B
MGSRHHDRCSQGLAQSADGLKLQQPATFGVQVADPLGAGVTWPGGEKAHWGATHEDCWSVFGVTGANSAVRLRQGARLQHAAICCGPQSLATMECRSGGSGTTFRDHGDGGNGTAVGRTPGSPVGAPVDSSAGTVGTAVAVGLPVGLAVGLAVGVCCGGAGLWVAAPVGVVTGLGVGAGTVVSSSLGGVVS